MKIEWKLFILARNPCAILARPQWELPRGQFFKLSLREDKFLRFGELLLARCRREADFGRGHLCFSDSPLIGFFLGFFWLLDFSAWPVVLLIVPRIVANMVSLRSCCYGFLWGI